MNRINNLPYLKEKRVYLRNHMTKAELELWQYLKDRQLEGRKFRRQHSINNYIVDFYCPSERIIIELDGEYHYQEEQLLKDKERDMHLTALNFKVLRFDNIEVLENLPCILKKIKDEFQVS